MTRKDYERIARAIEIATLESIRNVPASETVYYDGMRDMRASILKHIGAALAEDNPRFDFEKFRIACMVEK
jgi:hypothetical protein